MRTLPLLLVLALGCAHDPAPPSDANARPLEAALVGLPGAPDPGDATRLAVAATRTLAELQPRYRPVRPPHLGNLAFHLGLRDRALCCHWVEDLLRALLAVEQDAFELHWGVAHFGSRLREHSAVVAVPRGGAFEEGLVLDAWRDSGRLHFVRVDRDRYPWRPHPSDAERHRLACGADG